MSSGSPPPLVPAPGPNAARKGAAPQRGLRATRLLFAFLVLMVVGPCAYQQAPLEVSRWNLAAALEHREAGRNQAAGAALDRAMSWDPDNPALFLKRAQWRQADRQFTQALGDVEQADELLPDDSGVLSLKGEILQHLGRHGEAIQVWQTIDRLSLASGRPSREDALNGLAYARAVADVDLEAGLKEVEQALELEPGNAAMLDTRGFLLYRQGKYDDALRDMEPAVRGVEHQYRRAQAEPSMIERVVYDSELSEPPSASLRQATAVIRYHRALVLEKLGRHAEAKLDRSRAKLLLGREPDESLF